MSSMSSTLILVEQTTQEHTNDDPDILNNDNWYVLWVMFILSKIQLSLWKLYLWSKKVR